MDFLLVKALCAMPLPFKTDAGTITSHFYECGSPRP